jgi:hypothetical protein
MTEILAGMVRGRFRAVSDTNQMKTLAEFLAFEDALTESLRERDDVIGLVFVGSAADHSRFDEWSDHDFFVITVEGAGEGLRQNLDWLPNHEQIAIRPRETAHGLKVVYGDGHVLEFAVFNDSELELAGANAYLVTLDKPGNIGNRMAALATKSAEGSVKAHGSDYRPDAAYELFLCQLLIGVGRARRGELLIAGEHVRSWAVSGLVGLIRHWHEPEAGATHLTDNLNDLRRFERQYPPLGRAIAAAQGQPVEQCAQQLLAVAFEAGESNLDAQALAQAEVVKTRLGWLA